MGIRLGVPELVLILVIIILLFGVGRVSKIAGELGSGIRSFREGLRDPEEEKKKAELADAPAAEEKKDESGSNS
jgi:sec-independent protein translocase protein TatA